MRARMKKCATQLGDAASEICFVKGRGVGILCMRNAGTKGDPLHVVVEGGNGRVES